MSTQHTPGPWDLEEGSYGEEIWLGGTGAGMIVVNGWVNGGCMDDPVQWAKLQADARLIAAAPDLLAACVEFVRKVDAGEARSTKSAEQMRAAIAKATGAA